MIAAPPKGIVIDVQHTKELVNGDLIHITGFPFPASLRYGDEETFTVVNKTADGRIQVRDSAGRILPDNPIGGTKDQLLAQLRDQTSFDTLTIIRPEELVAQTKPEAPTDELVIPALFTSEAALQNLVKADIPFDQVQVGMRLSRPVKGGTTVVEVLAIQDTPETEIEKFGPRRIVAKIVGIPNDAEKLPSVNRQIYVAEKTFETNQWSVFRQPVMVALPSGNGESSGLPLPLIIGGVLVIGAIAYFTLKK